MNIQEIKRKQLNIAKQLTNKQLKDALDALGELVKETQNSTLIDAHYNIETSYKSLLRYTVEGILDPERQKIYNQIIADLFNLSDSIFFILKSTYSSDFIYEVKRKHKSDSISIEDKTKAIDQKLEKWQLMENKEGAFSPELNQDFEDLFEWLMTQPQLYKNEKEIEHLFVDGNIPWTQQCILVSAVTLLCMNHFNMNALNLLFKLIKHPNLEVKQRALVGLLLILFKFDERLKYYPSITKQLIELQSNIPTSILQGVIIQIMRTLETEGLARKFTDEILPEVARIHPNLRDRLDLDNILGENLMEGKNPDWEDIFSDSPELLGKLEEFSKLQMEGADLFVSTFRMLKHFPFFNQTSNWFLPFSYPNPQVDEILKDETGPFKNPDIIESMASAGLLCNSDKYSLILSIPVMPQGQKEMMGQMFLAEIGAAREVEKSDALIDPDKQALSISNQYIQDLYRFFRVHPRKNSMEDPFSWKLDFHNKGFVTHLFPHKELLPTLGDYLFKKDRYSEALEVFNSMTSSKPEELNIQVIQKIAFCYQQEKNYEKALENYLKADLIDSHQVWNLKKIALCYHYLKDSEKALKYYQKAEKVDPNNLHTQVSIGHSLLEMKEFDEALKYYFKVEYLDPKNKKVWRPIVWCAFTLGKFDQAEKYCLKLIDDAPTQNDYLNMGHITWSKRNRQEALEWYQKCVTHSNYSLDKFLEAFANDKETLIKHNIDANDIPIMLDQLRYYLENK